MSDRLPGFEIDREFERARARLADVVGPAQADAIAHERDHASVRGDSDRVALPVALTWGWLLDRPTLNVRDRALALISVDVARGSRNALRAHVRLALSAGVAPAELHELLIQLGPFAGYPLVNDAATIVRDVLQTSAKHTPADTPTHFDRDARFGLCTVVVPDARAAAQLVGSWLSVPSWRAQRVTSHDSVGLDVLRAVGFTAAGTGFELLQPMTGIAGAQLRLLASGPYVDSVTVRPGDGTDGSSTWSPTAPGLRSTILDGALPRSEALDHLAGSDEVWEFAAVRKSGLGERPLDHIGVVTASANACTASIAGSFGASRWKFVRFATDDGSLAEHRYQGEPGAESYLTAMARVGNFRIEVCQPISGPSRYDDFLAHGGDGVHHLFFGAVHTREEWDETVGILRADFDLEPVTEATAWGGAVRYGYLPTRELVGFDLELALIDPDASLDIHTQRAALIDHSPHTNAVA